ncbi:Hypothetical predicted protein [Podarcis lilfordi]|uniref:Uncharacterized protein n=1 Tax=Podarcis lilfordi TaxID=74358 RepID=A0AA35KRL1_9SAUR|nr:Hypothetical predicted protein [Podarcis lilfordi]
MGSRWRRQALPQPPSPRAESASWFSGDPKWERELVDASELRTVQKGGQESCNLGRERGTPLNHPLSPREEVEAGMASTPPRGNDLVYAEPKEMEFSEVDAVEWLQNPGQGGYRCRDKFPKMGQSILMGPRVSRMAYEYQDLPQQLQEVSVGDYHR